MPLKLKLIEKVYQKQSGMHDIFTMMPQYYEEIQNPWKEWIQKIFQQNSVRQFFKHFFHYPFLKLVHE